MKKVLSEFVEKGRIAGPTGGGPYGMFRLFCEVLHRTLNVQASDGRDWSEPFPRPDLSVVPPKERIEIAKRTAAIWGDRETIVLPEPVWEHVSVSARGIPSWEEMCWVKGLFFEPHEWVVQFHPAESDYVNIHPYTLHLWRPVGVEIPVPPKELV